MARQQRRTGRLTGIWRRRLRGSALVAGGYALPIIWPQVYGRSWHWFGSVWFNYGELLSLLPGAAIVALVAPMVGYRRRKACAIFFPPAGIRVAWVVGIRLAQLPARPWPEPVHEMTKPAARGLAVMLARFRNWRDRRHPPPRVESGSDSSIPEG